jgi:AcrR family transcriptional regulator
MSTTTRPGGRTERTRRAVLGAAFTITAEAGYGGLTIDAVAERSSVHKTTIYRRWGSADAILFDAIVSRAESAVPLPNTGDARADLNAMARAVATNLEDPMSRAVAAAALSGTGDGSLKELSDRFWDDRIGKAAEIVKAGQKDGQIDAKPDPSAVVVAIIGPIWFRVMVLQSPVDQSLVEALVDSAIR